ncbi:hypothetical protein [Catellatospora chokoriensis]|uniref:Uncharacterized protein n=1 Tax=Catellatospora chokoriensis TaxID=310353 RepID=A0A8J3NVU0_9ACTN|nr:hypothetical protein [Catellatospora chokoriensis]GIF94317.1 hypothetical protein Cch02nite_77610 [Catellatospora chokoriensis]
MSLDERLRRTLHAVAEAMPEAAPAPVRAPRRLRKRVAWTLAALVVPLAAAGYALGAEYVKEMPPTNALFAGDAHGERYWLVPGRVLDQCGFKVSPLELVVEEWNTVGQEWNTVGVGYGETVWNWVGTPSASPNPGGRGTVLTGQSTSCGVDESAWLAQPARFEAAHVKLDGDRIYMIAVHPTVTAVRVATPRGTETIATITTTERPDGPRYAAFDVPESSAVITVTLLDAAGNEVGSRDLARPRQEKG